MFSAFSQVVVVLALSLFSATDGRASTANPSAPVGAIYFVPELPGTLPGQEWLVRRLTIIEPDGKVTRRGGRDDLGSEYFHQLGYDWARDRILAITDSGHHLSIGIEDGVAEYLFWDTSVLRSGIVGGRDGWIYYWSGTADDDGRVLTQTLSRRKPFDEIGGTASAEPLYPMPVTANCRNVTWVDNFQGRMAGIITWCDDKPYFLDSTSLDFLPIDLPAVQRTAYFTWHDRATDSFFALTDGGFAGADVVGLAPRSKRWEKTASFTPNKPLREFSTLDVAIFIPGPVHKCPCE